MKATTVVESLGDFQDDRCVSALFTVLRRVPSSNRTRRYFDTVIRALLRLPSDKVQQGFWELASDSSFSYRSRRCLPSSGLGDRGRGTHNRFG